MENIFLSALTGFFLAVIIGFIWLRKSGKKNLGRSLTVYSTLEKFRSVGELVVFKIITKEIITTTEHWFGEIGKKYLQWLASNKKIAMIFQFEIDFKYDLQSTDFTIELLGEDLYRLTLPPCQYESHIKDIHIYDEQKAQILPWLLPDLVNRVFDGGFNESTKNNLMAEAKHQAALMADEFVQKVQTEVHNSARQTLEVLAKGFGDAEVLIEWKEDALVRSPVKSREKSELP